MLRTILIGLLSSWTLLVFGTNIDHSPSIEDPETTYDLPMGREVVYENCGDAYFVFERANPQKRTEPLTITIAIAPSSTATPGEDFVPLPSTVTIPAGKASLLLPVTLIDDGLEENIEQLNIKVNAACQCRLPFDGLQILEVDPLSVSLKTQQICVGESVELIPVINGGLSNYSYRWSTGATTAHVTVDPTLTTEYSVTVTDACANESMAVASVEVVELPGARLNGPSDICTGNASVSTTVELSGTGPWVLSYSLDGIAQPPLSIQEKNYTITLSGEGLYTLESVRGFGSCEGEASGEIRVEKVNFSAAYVDTPVTCFGQSDGAIDLTVSGATAPYQYQWTGALPAQEDQNNIPAGDYYVLVSDAVGCTLSAPVRVRTPELLEATDIRLRGSNCDLPGASIDLTVAGGILPYSYQWNHIVDNVEDPGNIAVGSFSVVITDANGCTANKSINVADPSSIDLQIIEVREANCANPSGGRIDLRVAGSYSPYVYDWNNGLSDQEDPAGLMQGSYTVRVVDAIGCSASTTAMVPGNFIPPIADAGPSPTLLCPNIGIEIDGSSSSTGNGISYYWSSPAKHPVADQTELKARVFDPGQFTLLVKDNKNGCMANSQVEVLLDNSTPYVVIDPPLDTITCFVPEFQLDAGNSSLNGGYSTTWMTFSGEIVEGTNTLSARVANGGFYALKISNEDDSCFDIDSVRVLSDLARPRADGGKNTNLNCLIQELKIGGSNSSRGDKFVYNWSTPDGAFEGPTNEDSLFITRPGTYLFTVYNTQNGCSDEDEILVVDTSPSDIILGSSPPICFGQRGNIEILGVVGGPGPYYFSIDGGNTFTTEQSYNHLLPERYVLLVRDEDGCEVQEEILLPEKEELILETEPEISLEFGETYLLNVSTNLAEENTASISWTPPDFLSCDDCLQPTVTATDNRGYAITIRDISGCEATASLELIVDKEYRVYIPNVFSPYRQDGINDIFYIHARTDIVSSIRQFRIVDRWGNLMFENRDFQPNDPTQGWDGLFGGKPLNPTVLVYIAEIEYVDGEVEIVTGDIVLMD